MNMNPVRAALALACALTPAFGVEPIADLDWCPGSRDCLQWTADAGADHFNVYRGSASELESLLGPDTDSCVLGSYATGTTGAFGDREPGPGDAQWYLVAAVDPAGVETMGAATAGPRSVDSGGPCSGAPGLVLNEVDYDQPGADSDEFVEIYNPGSQPAALANVVLILVNGSTRAEYHRVALAGAAAELGAGGHLVVGAGGIEAGLPPGIPFASLGASIQNGAPDGIALFDIASETLLDALSYEGALSAVTFEGIPGTFDLVEGSPTGVSDSNAQIGALVRFPDGRDSGDAAADWFFAVPPTPGAANAPP